MVRQCCVVACALVLLFASAAAAQVRAVSLSVEVPAGKWKAVRLRALPKDAVVAVRAKTSGEVMLAFLDAEDYKRFPAPTRPLFNGRVEKQIAFALRMPEVGDYFVVLDNRLGNEPQTVAVRIQAARGTRKNAPQKAPIAFEPG